MELSKSTCHTFHQDYAPWYDITQSHKDHSGELNKLKELYFSVNSRKTGKILEVGCGTGIFTIPFYQEGFPIVGIDPSPSMIRIAKAKNKEIPFYSMGIEEFTETGFRFCFSMGHIVNYLKCFEEAKSFFSSVHHLLAEGGIYVFDCWNPKALLEVPPQQLTRSYETQKYKIIRPVFPHLDSRKMELILNYHLKILDKHCERERTVSTIHELKLFEPHKIKNALAMAGFKEIEIEKAPSEVAASDKECRHLWFTCKN